MDNLSIMSNEKFNNLEKIVYKAVCEFGCTILKDILETLDKELMKNRDKKTYRHKGYRTNCIKTLMGDVEYTRAIYLVENGKKKQHIFLLDKTVNINCLGKISFNLAEKMAITAVDTISYRKGALEIQNLTNETISHEGLREVILKLGYELEKKEEELIKLHKKEKIVKGTKEIPALFEEADGLWINLQGKDRKELEEKYKRKCEKENKEYKLLKSIKSELKLYVSHEGWEKNTKRHNLVNKMYITGFMTPQKLQKIRNAKIYQTYNEKSIKLRVINGDGANWIKNLCAKDTIYQKDNFHIQRAIIRNISSKEHQQELAKLLNDKRFDKVHGYIENLKYELGGEEKVVNKLTTLQKYLKEGLPRYKDVLKAEGKELPQAPENIEYHDMGIMESQIFSVLSVRLCSGRKSFSKLGSTYLAKICAIYAENQGKIEMSKIESEIPVDNSVEEWIKEIEQNVSKNKKINRADKKMTSENNYAQAKIIEYTPQLKEILKLAEPTALIYR